MNISGDYLLLLSTFPGDDNAKRLARILLEKKLAACINIIKGVESMYIWQGEIMQDDEVLLLIKTRRQHYDTLEQVIKTEHPYDVPEILTFEIAGGLSAYLDWIAEVTARTEN